MNQILEISIEAAIKASFAINEVRAKGFDINYKLDNSPVTMADLKSSDAIVDVLSKSKIPLIGEEIEIASPEERANWNEVFIFDPLDGTREFARNSDEFCVCIAYVENHRVKYGVIANPTSGELIYGGKSIGSFIGMMNFENNEITEVEKLPRLKSKDDPESIIMSRFEKSAKLSQFTASLKNRNSKLDVIKMGSALKFHQLTKGIADIYPRFAPTMEWDIAAGQAILEGVGGSVIHMETKEPLRYNKGNLYNPYFLAFGNVTNALY